MRYFRNPYRDRDFRPPPWNPAVREFHRTLPGYGPSPLRVVNALDSEIYVKDESTRFGLNAFKGLGASWAMHHIPAETYSAATDGNHGRAVAWMAKLLGARSVIFIPGGATPARVAAIRSEGADVRIVNGTYDEAVRECARVSQEQGWQVISDTGYEGYRDVPALVMEGYGTLFDEFEEQRIAMGLAAPRTVVIQAGVGGLLCAAIRHFAPRGAVVVAVEPGSADCLFASITSADGQATPSTGKQDSSMECLNCGEVSLAAWPTVRAGCDIFLAIEDSLATNARTLVDEINWGPSGVAGIAGLLGMRRAGCAVCGPVLVINSEGPPI